MEDKSYGKSESLEPPKTMELADRRQVRVFPNELLTERPTKGRYFDKYIDIKNKNNYTVSYNTQQPWFAEIFHEGGVSNLFPQ